VRPRARLQKGPYDIVKVGVGIKAVGIKIMMKKTRDKRKRVQKYLSHAHKVCDLQRNSFGSKMEAFAEFGVF
jgi:organic hydroperoxide reductase OsmC/OhrA